MTGDPRSWRRRHLAREATRNVFEPSSRLSGLLGLAVVLGVLLPGMLVWERVLLDAAVDDLSRQGRNIAVIESPTADRPVRISRASCESLALVPGVARAGLLIPSGRGDVLPLGTSVPRYAASRSLVPAVETGSAAIGHALLRGAWASRRIRLIDDGLVMPARPLVDEPEALGLAGAVVTPLAPEVGGASRCVVIAAAHAPFERLRVVLAARLDIEGPSVIARPLLAAPYDPVDAFLGRAERWAPHAIGALGAVAFTVVLRFRSGEISTYLLSGTRPRELALLVALENTGLAGAMLASGLATATVCALWGHDPVGLALWSLAGAGAWAGLGTLLTVATCARLRVSELAKDR
jgi:hypothetical protein